MDNICHTLVGAALAESGLKRRTALGTATLMIAANFPDIDVIAVPLGHSLGFRRGITHGLPAHIILPFVLTALMLAWHRWKRPHGDSPDAKALLLLSAIGIATHPFLDWMNTYGMRWLMPMSGQWWYADTLFIADPWIWIALGSGVWLSRRRARRTETAARATKPARLALAGVALYIAAMGSLSAVARSNVTENLASRGVDSPEVVVSPMPANPLARRVIYEFDGAYHFADYRMWPGSALSEPWFTIPRQSDHPAVRLAAETPAGREYHSWSRLPYYGIEESGDTTWVSIGDARYTMNAKSSWAATRIPVVRRGTAP
jgi:inner membrane protein